jgi:RNA polymerase sigma factor (sigma-70 family)
LCKKREQILSDKEYIQGLINEDREVLEAIYQDFSGKISNYIMRKGGSSEDAKDIFQDALLIIIDKVQHSDFQLTSSFYTYIFSINKYLWFNKAKGKSRKSVLLPDDNTLRGDNNIERELLNKELDTVFQDNFKKLGEFCQQLLTMFFEKKDTTTIAKLLKLTNAHAVRTRKYRCQETLKKIMLEDSRYKELRSDK